MKIDKIGLLGFFLILLGLFVYVTSPLDQVVMMITWPLLSGSSEGKAVLLMAAMGSFLLLNSLINTWGVLTPIKEKITNYSPDGKKFFKWTLIIIILTCVVGVLIEFYIRLKYGVSPLTIFVSTNPTSTSTSPMHTHVFKSVFGHLADSMGGLVPEHVHTGGSLYPDVIPWAYFILITLPLACITGLFSLDERKPVQKVLIAFALTIAIIGMVDGGLYSQPLVFGLGLLILIYFVRTPFQFRQLAIPIAVMGLIVLSGVGLELAGNNSSYREITVINQFEPVDLSDYNVLSTQKEGNRTVIRMDTSVSDKQTLESLFVTYQGRADGFFMTWDFFSYF
ncbi:hypothetical protein [Methanobacterium petrolearium]|uniref:hypothetical protein n=1 Tax=Methanobacterium petrolearium TaxID=710190 RepID=UPI001AE99A17|nr:hypothetical protein [Methanobacterium petrolearium]MBP1946937.1 hypothetical protein [Methanobacterium petrolearium]BDZ72073.1 hypothetical protein GCM10025861_25900 [Methanobacterium petrolearium]